MNINTSKSINENDEQKKYYLLCETTEEGIQQFKAASSKSKEGVTISKMCVDGVMVPALKFEVDENTYHTYKREECPYGYNHSFRSLKRTILFSSLELEDSEGNSDPFEPASPASAPSDYAYFKLLSGLIEYVKNKYPKYSEYTDLLALLGLEFSVKEASDILDKSPKTLYGWIKKLRSIYNEYNQSII